jgi:hypothetical protein
MALAQGRNANEVKRRAGRHALGLGCQVLVALGSAIATVIGCSKGTASPATTSRPPGTSAAAIAQPAPTRAPITPFTLFSRACSGRTLIGIDPYNNVAYVPVYSVDHLGNAQLAVVNLAVGAVSPVRKTISLTGSVQPVGVAYNPVNRTILADARTVDNHVFIYEIDTDNTSVSNMVTATGLFQGVEVGARNIWGAVSIQPAAGGIVENILTNQAIVAGTATVGILDTSKSPPVWNPRSVISLDLNAESFALNSSTALLFISNLGTDALIDTSKMPLSEIPFARVPDWGVTDGVAFDISTNIVIHSEFDGSDQSYAFNFATLDTSQRPATADSIAVPGLGFVSTRGPVPGGQTVINCGTHQAVIADEFGPNFRLVQMPAGPIVGALNNKGQPGSGTTPDKGSVFTIAAAAIPAGKVGAPHDLLSIVGNPSSLTVDPLHNFAYMLADNRTLYHPWTPGSQRPLFLVRVDLAEPVFGAGPFGGIDGKTFWGPRIDVIRMP